MAVHVTRGKDRLILRHFRALWPAILLSVIASRGVWLAFLWAQRDTQWYHVEQPLFGLLFLAAIFGLSLGSTRLEIDLARSVGWRWWSIFRRARSQSQAELLQVELLARPKLWLLGRGLLRLSGAGTQLDVPLGWYLGRTPPEWMHSLGQEVASRLSGVPAPVLPAPSARRRGSGSFSLARLMVLVTACAIALGLVRNLYSDFDKFSWVARAAIVLMVALPTLLFRRGEQMGTRLAVAWLALYGPYLWIIEFLPPLSRRSGVAEMIPWLPGLLPALLAGGRPEGGLALIVFPVAMFTLGLLCARRGWPATLKFAIPMGLVMTASSLVLYAGFRM